VALTDVSGENLRRWRESQGWDVPRMARELRKAARDSGEDVAAHHGLVKMIPQWERGSRMPRERYRLLYLKIFQDALGDLSQGMASRAGTGSLEATPHDDLVQLAMTMGPQLGRIAEELKVLARVQDALRELYSSVLGQDVGLHAVLRQVVTTAMELVDARYGALGVLSKDGDHLVEFIPVGLTRQQEAAAASLDWPRGLGLLAPLRVDPSPLRVASISEHPMAVGLPPGHPEMRTLLGVMITSRRRAYGNLYVSDRLDGQPFDEHDESMLVALAGAAGLAIDQARLFGEVRSETEEFQRLLLPQLPDLRPIEAGALYQPASGGRLGGDWYDAVRLPEHACAVVIGDVCGHSMQAAAEMSNIRSMLRALLLDRHGPPGAVLTRLDRALESTAGETFATACLALLQPIDIGWRVRWSAAGHPAPLLLMPGEPARYLDTVPGLPLGVDSGVPRPDQHHRLPGGSTLVFFTDGLVQRRGRHIDEGLSTLAGLATQHADLPPERLCQALADGRPGYRSDDVAIIALRLPAPPVGSAASPGLRPAAELKRSTSFGL
jgi:serine phosphatase RsbU (regulator of sigma subunit)/transcriptional regulator with XRE-family HTH domain